MTSTKFLISIFLLLTLSSCTKNENKPSLEILQSLQFVKESGGQIERKNEMVFKPDSTYGWFMYIRTNKENVEIQDVIHLPEKGIWPEKTDLIISDNKKNAMSKRIVSTSKGIIQGGWAITEGDPKGTYVEDVYVDNKHIKTFFYQIK